MSAIPPPHPAHVCDNEQHEQLVDDLIDPILCTAARLVLSGLPNLVCPRARKFPRPLIRADRLSPVLHSLTPLILASPNTTDILQLVVVVFPDLYSIQHACTRGHVALLHTWRRLLLGSSRRRVVPICSDTAQCIDMASALGHLPILDWWLANASVMDADGQFKYSHMAVHLAVLNAYPSVVHWWLRHHPLPLPLKTDFPKLLMHAIEFDAGAALHRWLDYGLPLDANPLNEPTTRDALQRCFIFKSWTVLDWWKRAMHAGILEVPKLINFDPHPHPVVYALEWGIEGVFERWVSTGLPLPPGMEDWVLDTASAGGLASVLVWWQANRSLATTQYSAVAMDSASFGAPIKYASQHAFAFNYPSVPASRRLAVLDWWHRASGLPLKYSPDLALAMLELAGPMSTPSRGHSSGREVVVPVLQWWVDSGLDIDWTTNARPQLWDIGVREWWEREYLKLEAKPEPLVGQPSDADAGAPRGVRHSLVSSIASFIGGFRL